MDNEWEGPNFPPPHPGEYIREDIIPALGMSVKALADHLGVQRQTLSELIHEKRSVSVTMAIRLGQAFKNGARFWLALQMQHDLWHEERRFASRIEPLEDCATA